MNVGKANYMSWTRMPILGTGGPYLTKCTHITLSPSKPLPVLAQEKRRQKFTLGSSGRLPAAPPLSPNTRNSLNVHRQVNGKPDGGASPQSEPLSKGNGLPADT